MGNIHSTDQFGFPFELDHTIKRFPHPYRPFLDLFQFVISDVFVITSPFLMKVSVVLFFFFALH